MLKIINLLCAVLVASLFAISPAFAQTLTWTIDPNHSSAQFTVRHMAISNVTGTFTKVSGTIDFNEKDIAQSQVSASIDVNSVDTRVAPRDADLRSPNFFEVAKYPTIDFRSKKIVNSGGKLQLIGDLTMHGVTREITLDVDGPTPEITDTWGNARRGLSATGSLKRQDYGLVWNNMLKTGEAVVGDIVKLQIDVEMIHRK
jgi:polyisoprenoid-binding protein YceI